MVRHMHSKHLSLGQRAEGEESWTALPKQRNLHAPLLLRSSVGGRAPAACLHIDTPCGLWFSDISTPLWETVRCTEQTGEQDAGHSNFCI